MVVAEVFLDERITLALLPEGRMIQNLTDTPDSLPKIDFQGVGQFLALFHSKALSKWFFSTQEADQSLNGIQNALERAGWSKTNFQTPNLYCHSGKQGGIQLNLIKREHGSVVIIDYTPFPVGCMDSSVMQTSVVASTGLNSSSVKIHGIGRTQNQQLLPEFKHPDIQLVDYSQVTGDDSISATLRFESRESFAMLTDTMLTSFNSQGWKILGTTDTSPTTNTSTWRKGSREMQSVLVQDPGPSTGFTLVLVSTI